MGFKFRLFRKSPTDRLLLKLSLGYSHLLSIQLPVGCEVFLLGKRKLFFKGVCLQELTQFVSFLQGLKVPDAYKGKGLNYRYKVKLLKPGKKT